MEALIVYGSSIHFRLTNVCSSFYFYIENVFLQWGNWTFSFRIHVTCPGHLSYRGDTFPIAYLCKVSLGGMDIFNTHKIIPCKPVWVVPPSVSRTWGCLSPASLNSLSTQRSCRGFAIRGFVWCSPGQVGCGDNVCCCKANLSLENTHQIKLIVCDMND